MSTLKKRKIPNKQFNAMPQCPRKEAQTTSKIIIIQKIIIIIKDEIENKNIIQRSM